MREHADGALAAECREGLAGPPLIARSAHDLQHHGTIVPGAEGDDGALRVEGGLDGDAPAAGALVETILHLIRATRKIVPFASSLTSSAPSRVTATPAGRPQTVVLSITKPVMKSSYSPVGRPPFMRTRITL